MSGGFRLEHDAGVRECEKRHDREGYPGMERGFQAFQRRKGLARGFGQLADHLRSIDLTIESIDRVEQEGGQRVSCNPCPTRRE